LALFDSNANVAPAILFPPLPFHAQYMVSCALQDPKTSLLRGMRAASAGPSKLRIGSTTNDIVAPIDSVSMGPNLTAAFSVDSAAALTPNRAASLADPELSGGGAADDEVGNSNLEVQMQMSACRCQHDLELCHVCVSQGPL
jgi:hypothetical protein